MLQKVEPEPKISPMLDADEALHEFSKPEKEHIVHRLSAASGSGTNNRLDGIARLDDAEHNNAMSESGRVVVVVQLTYCRRAFFCCTKSRDAHYSDSTH